jgi:type 1 fimbria pilin
MRSASGQQSAPSSQQSAPSSQQSAGKGFVARFVLSASAWFLALSLSGCLLVAGEQASIDVTVDGGNVYATFVSADGVEVRSVATEFRNQPLTVNVSARTAQGQLGIEVLNPDDSVVFVVDAQAEEQYNGNTVTTNAAGEFRYRVRATGAQDGEFQILFQPGE